MHTRNPILAPLAALALVTAAACGGSKSPDPEYAKDADTGAAAPATQQTLSPVPGMGDSAAGTQDRTHEKMMAGDSGRPSLTTDSASRGTGVNPVPGATKRP